jgi:hypothetical protein
MAYRILVTGSRNWPDGDEYLIYRAILRWLDGQGWTFGSDPNPVVVHGGARGVDTISDKWATSHGWVSECHPADWKRWGRSAGHRRNAEMVALGADVCLAFPLGASPGTRGCMRLAWEAGIRVINCEGTGVERRIFTWVPDSSDGRRPVV